MYTACHLPVGHSSSTLFFLRFRNGLAIEMKLIAPSGLMAPPLASNTTSLENVLPSLAHPANGRAWTVGARSINPVGRF